MRRLAVIGMVLALAACEPLKDAFSARPEVAARVGVETLSVERLATLGGSAKQVPLTPEATRRLAQVWVDYTAFAERLAAGRPLDDSATAVVAMWPGIADRKWQLFHERLVAQRTKLTQAQVDSAYQVGELRLLQHILVVARQSAAPPVVADQQRRAEAILRDVRRPGARFASLARRYSEDSASGANDGLLGVAGRGAFVAPFEDAGWALQPGQISDLVRSPFGFHIIRRPPLQEVREAFQTGLEERLAFALDSTYADSLSKALNLKVTRSAPALTRQAVQSFETARASNATVASYRGGAFRVKDLVRWVYAMDPNIAGAIPNAPDSQITQFIHVVAQRQLLVDQADREGTALPSQDWQYLRAVHDSALRTLMGVIGLTPQLLRDSAVTDDGRRRFAVAKVNDYLERVVGGRASFVPIPPFLAEAVREGQSWSISAAGLRRALERAKEIRARTDSLTGPQLPGGPASGLNPAAGPPPVPGAAGDSGRR